MAHDRRKAGCCQDCGRQMPVRTVAFWLNGYRMALCADCERPYRRRLLRFPLASGKMTYGAPAHA